jgi:membrane protease YdiL (CAAX protease family)
MASEPPFAERPEDQQGDEHIPPLPYGSIQPMPPFVEVVEEVTEPSAVPPLPPTELVSFPPIVKPLARPQPGFWLGVLTTVFMFVLCQIAIPVVVLIIFLLIVSAGSANPMKRLGELRTKEGTKELQRITALPALVSAHVPMILLGLVALRIFAGRHWYREIAVRLPSGRHFVLLLLGFPALPILAGGAYWLAQHSLPGLGQLPALVLSQLVLIGVLSTIWLVTWAQLGHDPKLELARSPIRRQLLMAAVLVVVGLATARGALLLATHFLPSISALDEMDQSMEALVEETRTWPPVVAVLVIALMPAFSEEIWCRAFLGRGLVGQYGVVCGVLITSYFFGAIHVLPHQGAMAMLMGLVLHYAYITTRSLLAPMLLHFLNNATSVLGPTFGEVAANIDLAPDKVPLTLYACALLLLAAAGWALYQSRARIIGPDGLPYSPQWHAGHPGVALPHPYAAAIVQHSWPSAAAGALVVAAFGAFATVFVLGTKGFQIP